MPDITVSKSNVQAITSAMSEKVWICSECENIYDIDTDHCPNTLMDEMIFAGLIDPDDLRPKKQASDEEEKAKEVDRTTDPIKTVADALFKSWFPTTTIEQMKRRNAYNGEYEIAIEEALIAVAALGYKLPE